VRPVLPPVRIKVALDYRPALLSPAGIGRAVRELTRALAQRDDLDLHLFAHSLARARVPTEIPPGARLHRLPLAGRALPSLARLGLGAARLAGRPAGFHDTDYVELPITRARSVLTLHDLAFLRDPSWHGADSAALRERTHRLVRRAARIAVPSQATARDVRAAFPGAAEPVVVPFGSDHVPALVHEPRDHVLCVGTIEPRKNHRTLLAAMRRLRAPRPRLVVVGRAGWECDAVVADLRAAVDEGIAEWREGASDAETWELLRTARLLVYPSHWEGFGFPPLEAMAVGVPVVGNDCEPLRELCADAAMLCRADDADALAAAIERTLGDAALRERLARAGRTRAADFRWHDCAAAYTALYREAAA